MIKNVNVIVKSQSVARIKRASVVKILAVASIFRHFQQIIF